MGSGCLSAQESNHNNDLESRSMPLQRPIKPNPGQTLDKNVKKNTVTKYLRNILKG